MSHAVHSEIHRLKQLHQRAELELAVLSERRRWTPDEEREVLALKRLKLRLKDRMAWVEAILREHEIARDGAASLR
jgi:uncharacterized protein YdcH (DUF465 family)